MAYVYRPTHVDPLTGEKVRDKHWYIQYRDGEGQLREVKGPRGRVAALAQAAELERGVKVHTRGSHLPQVRQVSLPLSKHLEDFRRSLPAKEAASTQALLRALLEGCGFFGIAEIRAARVTEWLCERRKAADASCAGYRRAAMQFTSWLVAEGRLATDPLAPQRCPGKQGRA